MIAPGPDRPRPAPRPAPAAGTALAAGLLGIALCGCAAGGAGGLRSVVTPAPADSATVALWRFDETTGSRAGDSGPLRLDGRSGVDTRPDFGRIRNGRLFSRSIDSFVYVEHRPALDPYVGFTIEAWVRPDAWGDYEISPLAGRWTQQPSEQSWLLGISGLNISPQFANLPGPNFLGRLVPRAGPGYLVFAFVPDGGGAARSFSSAATVPLERWTHVAASFDGEVVRLFLNGRQDSQYASAGRIRASAAPLLMANYFDWRGLSEFGGDLRMEQGDRNPYYAFQGALDEVRLSNEARTQFPHVRN